MKIKNVIGREILDSRGEPTVEVDVVLENGIVGRASVPSGASTGSREALELRDNDSKRFFGKGVLMAIENINGPLKNLIVGLDCSDQEKIDTLMVTLDGTDNKSLYGANAILGVSLAVLKANALNNGMKLFQSVGDGVIMPRPMINIINGGVHANNSLDFQEFMIIPQRKSISENIRMSSEVFHVLKKHLESNGYSTGVGDEGGFAPNLDSNEEALSLITEIIKKSGYVPGVDISLGIDVAASELYKSGKYYFDGNSYDIDELINYYKSLISKYPIISIEDPVDEDDFDGFVKITKALGDKIQIVGDDLFVTNKKYLKKGIDMGAGNAILIKLNQIGTVTEALDTIRLAKENGYSIIISHRSGETEDTFIADLAVGLGIGQIKAGSMSRSDRICKYNRLLRIEELLNS